ncbi:MAG: helix-turn-helix domain-containing protein [Pirellulales bacterium]|nr:helix-turn-helix domain-containing protein [Pirellulales bacterium]
MKPVELTVRMTLDEVSARTLIDLIRTACQEVAEQDERRAARLQSSRNALFAGQKPPEDRGLLIDTNQAAKLLKVSARTIWRMEHCGEMPKAIRIGKAVRWSYEDLKAWIAAGCLRCSID